MFPTMSLSRRILPLDLTWSEKHLKSADLVLSVDMRDLNL